jgi:hypothetical protein
LLDDYAVIKLKPSIGFGHGFALDNCAVQSFVASTP